jgi:glutathione S-transferase
MSLTLYELPPSRSARVRWTLLELDLPFESRTGFDLFQGDELRKYHPLNKFPAFIDDGRPLFESAAICNWLADSHPDRNFIARPGTWQRALHDQWVSFILTEIEAPLWSTARNSFVLPEDQRIAAIIPQNDNDARRALTVLDAWLDGKSFLIDDRFSVTDVIAGYTVNWARLAGLMAECANLRAYNERLMAFSNCTLMSEAPQ